MPHYIILLTIVILHLSAVVGYSFYLMRGKESLLRWSNWFLTFALCVQGFSFLFELALESQRSAVHYALMGVSTLMGFSFLGLASRRKNLAPLGVFVAPIVLVLFGAAAVRTESTIESLKWTLLPIHIGVNVIGLVFFALAFVVAVAYLIQERLVRVKKVSGVFQRLPALQTLDTIAVRLVTAGFPLLTLGILSGIFWWLNPSNAQRHLSSAQALAIASWFCFGSVLLLRYSYGWRGRRAAIGTVLGFLCAIAVLLGYFARSANGVFS